MTAIYSHNIYCYLQNLQKDTREFKLDLRYIVACLTEVYLVVLFTYYVRNIVEHIFNKNRLN